MCGAEFPGVECQEEDVMECVPVEATRGVHGQRGWFVHRDEGVVFVEDCDIGVDAGFDHSRSDEFQAFSRG